MVLQLFVGHDLVLEFHQGVWRYVDRDATLERLVLAEPSIGTVNRKLWEVVVELSDHRHSSLILIVDDPKKLSDAGVCYVEEMNLDGPTRIKRLADTVFQGKETEPKPTLDSPIVALGVDLELRDFILEQYRGKKIADIGHNILFQLASVDGALILNKPGVLLGFGVVLQLKRPESRIKGEGAGARAAKLASEYGVAIKVSQDGPISLFKDGEQVTE
jgi:hypothetical protein